MTTAFSDIWTRRVGDMLTPESWTTSYAYNAATYFSLPLDHAYGDLGSDDLRADFRTHFQSFAEAGFDDGVGWLAKGQYLTFLMRFVLHEEALNDGATALTAALIDQVVGHVTHEWLETTDHDWAEETWTGRQEGIEGKLGSGGRRITDGDMFLLSLGASLSIRDVSLGGTASPIMKDMTGTALRVLETFGSYDENGYWNFSSGNLTTHQDYRLAHWSGSGPIPMADDTDTAAWDTSHASRWPHWLTMLERGAEDLGLDNTIVSAARAGLTTVFVDAVLQEDGEDSGRWLTTNFIDGDNGPFRWGYQSYGTDNGYAPYQLSGTFLLGHWSTLDDNGIDEAYGDLLGLNGFSPDLLDSFIGPVRAKESTSTFDWRSIVETGDIRLWLAIASGSTEIAEDGRIRIDDPARRFEVAALGELAGAHLLPDLSSFSGQSVDLIDTLHAPGTDLTGTLNVGGDRIGAGTYVSIAISSLDDLSYRAGQNAAGDRLYWRLSPTDDFAGSTWNSIDILRANTGPVLEAVTVTGARNSRAVLGDAVGFIDADGDLAGRYQIWHSSDEEGVGLASSEGWFPGDRNHDILASQVDDVTFTLDSAIRYWVRASDGAEWSPWQQLDFEATNTAPVVALQDSAAVNDTWLRLTDFASMTDAEGDTVEKVRLWDAVGSNSWWVDGSLVDATRGYVADDPASVWLRTDSAASTQKLWVAANDGLDWSEWYGVTLETFENAAPMVDMGRVELDAGKWTRLSTHLDYSDAENDAIHKIQLWDANGTPSWWADGSRVDASKGYVTDSVDGIWFQGDASASEQKLWIRANDGHHWSEWDSFVLRTNDDPFP